MDLQNVNLNKAVPAEKLSVKFNKLKWITPFDYSNDPNEEIILLKDALILISKKDEEIMLISHYQFFSTILEKNLISQIDGTFPVITLTHQLARVNIETIILKNLIKF